MEIGLYLHFPFCRRKCAYCDFASRPGREEFLPYLRGVLAEYRRYKDLLDGVEIATVYLGGGTPSLLSPELLSLLLAEVVPARKKGEIEVTMEANPESIDRPKLEAFVAGGGNRLSLGLQTHDDRLLARLGRLHTAARTAEVVRLARSAGVARINLDLIYGLPDQSPAHWEETLAFALSLSPDHLSLYALELHPGTLLAAAVEEGRLVLPPEEEVAAMLATAMEVLPRAGLRQYEVASFARPGAECRHNLNYWRRGPYLGLGAAAHSFFGGERWANCRDPDSYLAALARGDSPVAFREKIGPLAELIETVMLGLRLTEGISSSLLFSLTGRAVEELFGEALASLRAEGLVILEGGYLRLTSRGVLFADYVVRRLVGGLPEGVCSP
ncbi:MAG: radical SAM family heme chaperone HemW [Bacillota bacterium]